MIDLVARLRLRDDMTNPLRRASRQVGNISNNVSKSMSNMTSSIAGLAGAYLGAAGAVKAFNATIGAAAKYEQSEVAVQAIFNDKAASDAYLKMVDKMAIDSPLLSSGEMLSSSKGLVAMTKNVDELGKAWSIIEKLMVLDPTQGTDGAAFALKEMWQGDSLSMVERFGLNKSELNRIKKLAIPQQIAEINKLLDGMGITESTVNAMGQTTLGYWAQIQERAQKFMRTIGESGNSKLGDSLGKIVEIFDNTDLDSMAKKLGDALGTIVDKAIDVGKWLWKWREPVAYIVGALTAATGAFMAIGAIALLANPIALIGAGVAALVVGFKALYDNSEPVRNVIDGLVGKAKELFSAFQNGGTGGLLDALFGEGTAEKVTGIVDTIKTKFGEMKSGFEIVKNALAQGWTVLSGIFTNAWTIISPILNGLWSVLQVVGGVAVIVFNNVIAPALQFIMQLFTTLWAIAQPILTLIASLFKLLGSVVLAVWNTVLAPLVAFILGGLKNAFDIFSDALSIVAGWFEKVGGWANTAKGYISKFADMIASIKLPDWVTNGISTVVTTVGKVIGAKPDGSHYHGLDNVKRDGYIASLHRGEMVLNKHEANAYRAMQSGQIGQAAASTTNNVSNLVTHNNPITNAVQQTNNATNYVTNDNTRSITNDSSTSRLTSIYDSAKNYVTKVVEGAVSTITDTFNTYRNTAINNNNESSIAKYITNDSTRNITNDSTRSITDGSTHNITNDSTRNITNDSSVSKLTKAYDTTTNLVKNIVEGAISNVTDTFNTIYNATTAEESNVSNVTYNSHIAQPYAQQQAQQAAVPQAESGTRSMRQGDVTIAKLADQIIVREDADIDKIGWAIVQKLKEAEAAGV